MKRKIFFAIAAVAWLTTQAQDEIFCMGLVDDHEAISRMPMKKELTTRGFGKFPSSFSLQQYCPRPGSQSINGQGAYATCTAWATTYAAMTIMEAVRWGWTDRDIITSEAFAPLFVYANTKFKPDDECNKGVGFYSVLPFLQKEGAPKHRNYATPCDDNVPRWITDEAADHKITDYVKLFDEPYPGKDADKVRITKKSIAEKKPVIFAMYTPKSFEKAGEVWQGELADGEIISKYPNHCMCVVGYDDDRAGGAFLIMNSWGERWGQNGFTWIRYDDYVRFAGYAFEIYGGNEAKPVKIQPQPSQQEQKKKETPTIVSDMTEKTLAGSLYVKLSTGETLDLRRTDEKPCPVYRTKEGGSRKFLEGTRCQLLLTNEAPSYVYVIGTDLNNEVDSVFPPAFNDVQCHISPVLSYAHSEIALPAEDIFAELYGPSDKSFFCVLYATHALPMDRIMEYIKENNGDIEDKFARALDLICPDERVLPEEINCERNRIAFSATTTRNIVPLIIEMKRK